MVGRTGLTDKQQAALYYARKRRRGLGAEAPAPAGPDAFTASRWSIAAGEEQATVTINSLPADNGSAITDIEYRVDGGSWTSSGGIVGFDITGLTNGVSYAVQLRAVNAIGESLPSDTKSVTPVFVVGPTIALSPTTFAEDDGPFLAVLSVINGDPGEYEFEITDDPDGLFAIDGDDFETPTGLDYETATSHQVSIRARLVVGPGSWIGPQTFNITVTDVDEPSDSILLETGDALLLEAGGALDLDTGIPAQAAADPLDGTEWTVIVQGGTTKKVATLTLAEFL